MWIATFIFGMCMLYYAVWIVKRSRYFKKITCDDNELHPFVSVIIPARNEEAGIGGCLRSILAQDYPADRFEVILVNDHSTDNTRNIAEKLLASNENLIIIDLEADHLNAYKKAALSKGIAVAKGEIILQTDGDCKVEPGWIASIAAHFDPGTAMVSGPVSIECENNWLQAFQSMESMGLIVMGAGSIEAGDPNMCNGANLAYRKSIFQSVGGYSGIDQVASGDDELLMQKIAAMGFGIRFAKCPSAIVRTYALKSWPALKAQRLRWVSKARYYTNRRINLVQLVFYVAFWGFPATLVFSLFDIRFLICYVALSALKFMADLYLLHTAAVFFHKLRLLKRYLIPFRWAYVPYVLWVGIAGNFVKTYSWKGRNIQ